MKAVLISLTVLLGVGLSCSRVGYKKQDECRTTEDNDNLIIICSDNIIKIPKVRGLKGDRGSRGPGGYTGETGAAGPKGIDGVDGVAGKSCSVAATPTGAVISCEDGTSAVINNGTDGVDGVDGQNGADGVNGQDGQDGQNGADGADGQDSIVEVINPCGVEGGFEEVLFRLSNGKVYALYFSGSLSFLTELPPGNYQTTDSYNCAFTVHADLSVTW